MGTDRTAAGRRAIAPGRAIQSRLHRAPILALPSRYSISRHAAQEASGTLPLVRTALLAHASECFGTPLHHPPGRVRIHPRRPPALLPVAARQDTLGAPGGRRQVLRIAAGSRKTAPDGLHAASAQRLRQFGPRFCPLPQGAAGLPPGDRRAARISHRRARRLARRAGVDRSGRVHWLDPSRAAL